MQDTLNMIGTLQDIRHAFRMLAKARGFTAAALVCLALGTGANTAIFSVVNTVMIRPLPYPDADRLAVVREINRDGSANLAVASENFQAWQERAESVESVAAYQLWTPNLTGVGDAERLSGLRATSGFFHVLGVSPAIGTIWNGDSVTSRERVIIVTHSLWQRRFGGDPALLGRSVLLDGESYRIAGIMPPDFRFPSTHVEVYALMTVDVERTRGEHDLQVVLRRKESASWKHARAECTLLMQRASEQGRNPPSNWQADLIPLREWYGSGARRILWILTGAVSLVLLMACANVANLLLAYGAGREQEVRIRRSVGATRGRLISQFLTENLCLSVVGSVAGLLLAQWGRDALLALLPGGLASRFDSIVIDWRVLCYTLGVSFASALLFGLAPALQGSRDSSNVHPVATRSSASRLRGSLMVVETALAFILLAGAGLLIRSFVLLYNIDPGFQIDNVLTARVNLPASRYSDRNAGTFFEQVQSRLAALPGVRGSAAVTNIPLGGNNNSSFISFEGRPAPPPGTPMTGANRLIVTPGYFETMGIRLLQGRTFTAGDHSDAPPVVIINEAMARRYWPNENPIGRRIKRGTLPAPFPWMTVIGVVADVKHFNILTEAGPMVFLPSLQSPERGMTILVRSESNPELLAASLRQVVRSIDPDQPVALIRTFRDIYWDSLSLRGASLIWMTIFASVALILAAVGIYGVASASVIRRTRELGIRVALGARRGTLLFMVLRQGMAPVALGAALGVAGAAALTFLLRNQIYGISEHDVPAFSAASIVLLLVAFVACFIPARRATALDPAVVLRSE